MECVHHTHTHTNTLSLSRAHTCRNTLRGGSCGVCCVSCGRGGGSRREHLLFCFRATLFFTPLFFFFLSCLHLKSVSPPPSPYLTLPPPFRHPRHPPASSNTSSSSRPLSPAAVPPSASKTRINGRQNGASDRPTRRADPPGLIIRVKAWGHSGEGGVEGGREGWREAGKERKGSEGWREGGFRWVGQV